MKIIKNNRFEGKHNRDSLYDVFYTENNIKKPVVIFCHGFKGFKDWGCFDLLAKKFAENGIIFIKFNFCYNGGTLKNPIDFPDLDAFSENNFTKELDDLQCIINLLYGGELLNLEEINLDSVSIMGHSRGGGISLLKTAEEKRIASVITLASVSDFGYFFPKEKEIIDYWKSEGKTFIENKRTHQQMPLGFQLYEDFKANEDILNIKNACANINVPCLVFHGTEDDSVSLDSAKDISNWVADSNLYVLENSNHVFGGKHPYELDELPKDFKTIVLKTVEFLK